MSLFKRITALFSLLFLFATKAYPGSFWFPIDDVYPYTVKVTAFPDLDPAIGVIKTRMGENGRKSNGCIAYTKTYPCTNPYKKDYSVWGYKKDGGGKWNVAGIDYVSDPYIMWYDNHNGYDFSDPDTGYAGKSVHAVEDGIIKSVNSDWGQVEIEHNINGVIYRTIYTHMDISQTKANLIIDTKVYRWFKLGTVSNKTPAGISVGKHLHFVTKKKVGTLWKIVDPYGHWENGREVEPYLWE